MDSVNIETALKGAMTIDGAVGVSLVDCDSRRRPTSPWPGTSSGK
jgi:hypothetical protein